MTMSWMQIHKMRKTRSHSSSSFLDSSIFAFCINPFIYYFCINFGFLIFTYSQMIRLLLEIRKRNGHAASVFSEEVMPEDVQDQRHSHSLDPTGISTTRYSSI